MVYGTINRWDSTKGYGFITTDDDEDIFVHVNDLDISLKPKILREGLRVKFDIQSDIRGDKAVRVRLA